MEHFHEFLHAYTDIFTNNIYARIDYTYHNFRGMIQNKDILDAKGDKDSSIVIMEKSACVTKLDNMIDDGIMKGTYKQTTANTLNKLSQFQDFLYRNFQDVEEDVSYDIESLFTNILIEEKSTISLNKFMFIKS